MQGALTAQESDFSIVLGGPVYQALLRLRMTRPPLDLLSRRLITIPLIVWLPLLALAVISGRAWGGVTVPFLYDIDVHVRFLVGLRMLLLAEWVIHMRFRPLEAHFVERDIVVAEERDRFDEIIDSLLRLPISVMRQPVL